jgi:phosphatidylglycerophosphate synthase
MAILMTGVAQVGSPLLARAIVAAALGATVVLGLGVVLRATLAVSHAQPIVGTVLFASGMAVALRHVSASHPYPRLGPANVVTMLRATLVAVAGSLVVEPARVPLAWTAVALVLAVTVLDGFDGWLARRSGMASPFGARFDMETDALAILALSLLVWRYDKAGIWVVGCGLMRYVFVAAGWIWPWLAGPLRSTWRGKTVAVVQVVGLSAALAPIVVRPLSDVIAAGTLTSLAWSFGIDVAYLRRQQRVSREP